MAQHGAVPTTGSKKALLAHWQPLVMPAPETSMEETSLFVEPPCVHSMEATMGQFACAILPRMARL